MCRARKVDQLVRRVAREGIRLTRPEGRNALVCGQAGGSRAGGQPASPGLVVHDRSRWRRYERRSAWRPTTTCHSTSPSIRGMVARCASSPRRRRATTALLLRSPAARAMLQKCGAWPARTCPCSSSARRFRQGRHGAVGHRGSSRDVVRARDGAAILTTDESELFGPRREHYPGRRQSRGKRWRRAAKQIFDEIAHAGSRRKQAAGRAGKDGK